MVKCIRKGPPAFKNSDPHRPATDKQIHYIKGMIYSKSDGKVVRKYLEVKKQPAVKSLTVIEASNLIRILLATPTNYRFVCGDVIENMDRKEANCYSVLGEIEACLHSCPKNIDVNNCQDYIDWDSSQYLHSGHDSNKSEFLE